MTRVLITGVRGKTGVPLAELLVARGGVEVLGGSSDPSGVTLAGVQSTAFSWDDTAGWPAATDGVDAVYLVRPDRPDAPELIEAFLAVTAPATRVVLLSERSMTTFAATDWAPRVEAVVRAGSRPWTMLRPSWFMQVFTDERFLARDLAEGQLPFSGGGASIAWIDARDTVAVAEQALLDPVHAGEAYELSGPESLTLDETAAVLADGLGRPIGPVDISIEDAVAGLSGFELDLNVTTFERVHAGAFAGVTSTVEDITGRPAGTLRAFAEQELRHQVT